MNAFEALAAGELADFAGLPVDATVADATAAFGEAGKPIVGRFSGQPAYFREFASGAWCWVEENAVWLVELREPELVSRPLLPEATAPSGLGPSYEQHVWGSRGLVLHVRPDGSVRRLYAFEPEPTEDVLDGPIGRVEERRFPRHS